MVQQHYLHLPLVQYSLCGEFMSEYTRERGHILTAVKSTAWNLDSQV